MKKKGPNPSGGNMPQTEQRRYPSTQDDLDQTTAIPRDTSYDLKKVQSRTRVGSWGDECTFEVTKKGNCP